jgi:hypothetical protein
VAWPKGKPRTGHVNKDGTPHRKRGIQTDNDPRPKVQVIRKPDPTVEIVQKTAPKLHGQTNHAVIEPCPNCGYAYADGGACPECPWTRFDPSCPHCRKQK